MKALLGSGAFMFDQILYDIVMKSKIFILVTIIFLALSAFGCKKLVENPVNPEVNNNTVENANSETVNDFDQKSFQKTKIIFLHHSTGSNIWQGGVADWFDDYNDTNGTDYQITEQEFPQDSPYGWENYPYDYWNIWVNNAGDDYFQEEPTLEILTDQYEVIVWKHCFPVSDIEEDTGSPDISSSDKTIENYKLQYNALKNKMLEFPNNQFIVWIGAAQVQGATDSAMATRAKTFFDWVRNDWNETGDNIFVWDFYQLETEGELYLKNKYAEDPSNSHPNSQFAQTVAPYFAQRVVDVIEERGETGSIKGS